VLTRVPARRHPHRPTQTIKDCGVGSKKATKLVALCQDIGVKMPSAKKPKGMIKDLEIYVNTNKLFHHRVATE
jgi:hypothetical protein